MAEHHVIEVDGLHEHGRIRLHVEDDTCAELVVSAADAEHPDDAATVGLYLNAPELDRLAAIAGDVRRELAGDADPFAGCFDVEHHVGSIEWRIGLGPDHSKTGEQPRYVRLELANGAPLDLTPADAAWLAGALAQRVGELA